jgi:hypothetical protein
MKGSLVLSAAMLCASTNAVKTSTNSQISASMDDAEFEAKLGNALSEIQTKLS